MNRVPPARLLRLVPLAALVLATAAAAPPKSPASRPAAKAPAAATREVNPVTRNPKFRGWINGIPDTGQFLADSVWLLRVGPRVTRATDFVERWFGSYPEFRPPADSAGRVKFLQSLMNKDILGLTALALDRPLGFEDRITLRETRQRALADAVYRRFVRDSVRVSETEIRALWETHKWAQHIRHILVSDRNAAEMVRRELVSGRLPWTAAVKKYSRAAGGGPDGDLGWVDRQKMDRSVGNIVFALNPGEISKPVQDALGWHLVQSVERKPAMPLAYEGIRRALLEEISTAKSAEYTERLLALLRIQWGMQYDTTNALYASRHFVATLTSGQPVIGASIDVDATVPEFSDEDTARVLARWNHGGRFSLGDLVRAYSDIPPIMRPSLNVPEAVLGYIESTVLEPGIAEYGAQNGLESDSLVRREIDKKREELAVEHMYQDSVGTRVWVSKDERKAYYQKNLNGFVTFPSVQYAAITRPSRTGADSVERALRSGVRATAIIAADSAAGFVSGTIQEHNQSEHGPYDKALFEEMRPGGIQVRGPDKQGDYVILQLLSYDPGRQLSYDEAEPIIDQSLQNQKSDEALQAMVARLRKRYDIAWRPELAIQVRLVDPTLN